MQRLLKSQNLLNKKPFLISRPVFFNYSFSFTSLRTTLEKASAHFTEKYSIPTLPFCAGKWTSPTAFKHFIYGTFTLDSKSDGRPISSSTSASSPSMASLWLSSWVGTIWDRGELHFKLRALRSKADADFFLLSSIFKNSNPRGNIIVHIKD